MLWVPLEDVGACFLVLRTPGMADETSILADWWDSFLRSGFFDVVVGCCALFAVAVAVAVAVAAFAGIRVLYLVRWCCPCAGRHLLSLPPQRK
jgi:hypothetical protein